MPHIYLTQSSLTAGKGGGTLNIMTTRTSKVIEEIKKYKLVPVLVIERVEDAVPLAEALIAGGLPVAEVTFRTDAAEGAIRRIAERFPDILLGAGTVLTTGQADRAAAAGAQFLVSPGFNPTVVDHCLSKGITVIPGINSPSQVEMGLKRGLKVLKFFPAEVSGGIAMLKALGSVYDVDYIPTGGINAGNIRNYLDQKRVIACGGSWVAKKDLITAGNFSRITELCKEAIKLIG